MLDAGIGVVEALDILKRQTENKTLKQTIDIVYEDVQKGMSLSEAMGGKHEKVFPSLLINMVEAGEVSGNLDVIMERMAIHYEKEFNIENKIKKCIYVSYNFKHSGYFSSDIFTSCSNANIHRHV